MEENLEHWARALGRSVRRRKVFCLIYSSQKKRWTAAEIAERTRLTLEAALKEGKKLSANGLLQERKEGNRVVYEKDARVQHRKRAILRLADSKSAREALPTKRRPSGLGSVARVTIDGSRARVKAITLDDIDSFAKARAVRVDEVLGDQLSESQFRRGVQSLLGELGHFADWGGEQNDLFSTRLRIGGRRYHAAFAFKGPATRGALTPAKCGKNGDQIQRLMASPASVFIFQYNRQIAESVIAQMRTHAQLHSMHTRQFVYYGVINGADSARLVAAYPKHFGGKSRTSRRRTKARRP